MEWSSLFGKPYKCKSDYGPGYRETFASELKQLGIEVVYSSAYNPSSNALVERSVRTLKDLLKKVGPSDHWTQSFVNNSRIREVE